MSRNVRFTTIGIILLVAILAFEVFNFDTTRYALSHLLGTVAFMNVPWSVILAVAFCGIDFAGLLHLFTPDDSQPAPQYVWFMLGAWLCGASLNAILTWYAVSLTLLDLNAGNAVLSQAQLMALVPTFVALLVWLTRILFIGALSVMGEALLPLGYTPMASRYSVLDEDAPTPHLPRQARLRPLPDQPSATAFRPRTNVRLEE
jgi:hypothetical protein